MKNRIQTLKDLFNKENLDGYVLADKINIYYFTGCMSGARLLAPNYGENILFVYAVNYEKAKETAKDCRIKLLERGEDVDSKIVDGIKKLKLECVGFDTIDASIYLKLRKALKDTRLKVQSNLVWKLRKEKDETELWFMKKAAEITDRGMKVAFETIRKGLREYELAAEVEYAMRRMGSGGVAFDTIIASGVRSAFPHGGCTDRKIQEGDLVIVDIGATFNYYRADLTRTITVGKPSSKQVKIYKIVREAQNKAYQNVHAGVKARDIDAVARSFIENRRYGKYFVHGLGHGIGLDVHEPPTLDPKSRDILKEKNVITIEPGIYVVNYGGIRIEDTVLVSRDNSEKLTDAPYSLQVT